MRVFEIVSHQVRMITHAAHKDRDKSGPVHFAERACEDNVCPISIIHLFKHHLTKMRLLKITGNHIVDGYCGHRSPDRGTELRAELKNGTYLVGSYQSWKSIWEGEELRLL